MFSGAVFLKLSAISDHFVSGQRRRGPPVFRKTLHTLKRLEVNRKK
jgi:formate hydrogenlyase subunit 4